MSHSLKYYVSGHTAAGFVHHLESNIKSLNKLIVLQHTSRRIISDVLKKMQEQLGRNERQEILCSSFRADEVEGILFTDISVGIVAEHLVRDNELDGKKVDLHDWLDMNKDETNEKMANALQTDAYTHFAKGLHIHDDLEKIYIDEMDFAAADQIADDVIEQIFYNSSQQAGTSKVYERLFGTNTMDGTVNEVEQLIAPMQHRIFIKGRAGTGKSVLMKKVVEQSKLYGYDTEIYRCSFDPNSIDMVIIRALDYCLFDSTAPHEFFPERKTDQVVDLYQLTVTTGTDEKYAEQIQRVTKAYKAEMKKGLHCLHEMTAYEPMVDVETAEYQQVLLEISKNILNEI